MAWHNQIPAWGALLLSLVALYFSWRSTRHQNRSAAAAERSAAAAEQARAQADPPAVDWRIEHRNYGVFLLRNIGTDTATGVTVDQSTIDWDWSGPEAAFADELPHKQNIPSGASHEFLMRDTCDAVVPGQLWVSWHDGGPVAVPIPVHTPTDT